MAFVDAPDDLGVAAGAEDGRGARVGVDTRAKSAGSSGKQRSGSLTVLVSWRKKAHLVSSNLLFSPPKMSAQNLNRGVHMSGKKGGRLVPRRRFSKSNRPSDPSAGGDGLEEAGLRSYQRRCPTGVSSPTNPSGLMRLMARSTNSE